MEKKSINWRVPVRRAGLLATAIACVDIIGSGAFAATPPTNAYDQRLPTPEGVVVAQAQGGGTAAPFDELNAALEAARAKLDQLTSGAEVAALASKLREELASAQSENARLRGQMRELREVHEQAGEQVAAAEERLAEREEQIRTLSARGEELSAAADRRAAEVEELQDRLEAAEQSLASARSLRGDAEKRLADMQEVVESALGEAADLGQAVAQARRELADGKEEATRLRTERDEARQQLVTFRERSEELEQQLADVRETLGERDEENAALRGQVAQLEDGATRARDVARRNLLAVEDKIKLFNEAIAGIQGNSPEETATPAQPGRGRIMPLPPSTVPSVQNELSPIRSANASEGRQLKSMSIGQAGAPQPEVVTLAAYANDLPFEKRVQVQSLLADLKAETLGEGLLMRVPGEDLFKLDSEQIEATAYDALVKVAELISLHGEREVEIIGHTDAMGDAGYNQRLSERRAELVRDFFVENFDVEAARLKVKGLGEREPIATNTSQAGRRANRRVEVLIRN